MSTLQTTILKHPDSGTNNIQFDSSGNVSIGISTINLPSGKGLQVYDSSSPRIKLANSTTGTGTGDGSLLYLSGSDLLIDNKESAAMRFYTAATERLKIDSSGRVGIGESTMDGLLVIKGDSNGSTNPSIRLKDGTDTREAWISNTGGDLVLAVGGEDSTAHGVIKIFESGVLDFTQETGTKLRIDSSGRLLVGLSTTSLPHLLNVNGSTKTSWFSCETTGKTVDASGTAVLTINGSNPSFVQVYIKANFAANGALQAHFDYELITCDAQGSGGTTAIRQSLNESIGAFQISTSDFAVTKSGANIIITYTNQASGQNQISFYVNGKFSNLSLA